MYKPYQKHLEKTKLKGLAEWQIFTTEFIDNVFKYIQLYIESEGKRFQYKSKSGELFSFPHIGFLGDLCLNTEILEAFPTCCRYAALEKAKAELETAKKVFEEVVQRLEHSQKVWNQLKPEQMEQAQKAHDYLYSVMEIVMCGIEITEDMENYLSGNESIDRKYNNPHAEKWKEAYEYYKKKKRWFF